MKQAERTSETERLLHLILANIDDLIAVVDLEGRRLYNSPSYERIFGTSALKRGTDSFSEVHPDDKELVRQAFEATIKTGIGRRIVYRFDMPDGTIRVIESQGNLVRDAKGKPDKVIIVGRDITERRQSEQVLMEAEAKYRSLVEQSLVGVYMLQGDNFVHVNPKFAEIFGYTTSEMMSSVTLPGIIAEQERSSLTPRVREMLQRSGETLHLTFRGVKKDGSENDVEVYGNVTEFNGTLTLLGTLLDITDRKRGEEERSRLHSAVEQTKESIVITDIAGTIQYVNPAFEKVTGYTKAEAIGKNSRILKSDAQSGDFYDTMWATLKRGEVWAGPIVNKRKDGTTFMEEMVISPVRDSAGNVVNYVAVKRDVTREHQFEEQLRQTQKMESLRQLAAGMAHDFNNIVNVILGTFALLKTRMTPDATTEKYLTLGTDAVKRGAEIARRLVTFAQTETEQQVPIVMEEVIKDVHAALRNTIEKTIRIETAVDPDMPLTQSNHHQLYQSIITLSLNARDAIVAAHTPEGVITIGAAVTDGRAVHANHPEATASRYVRITVTDNGTGMTEEMRQRIFDPFITTEQPEGGRGLGLAMVNGVVKGHGGFIDVYSELGRGTTFSIYLPAVHREAKETDKSTPEVIPGGNETILVVEDEEALLMVLETMLQGKGYNVLSAVDGLEGFEVYKEHRSRIQAVITDMGLPKQSGYDMFLKIRALNPQAKVILASGYLDPALKSKLFVAGAKAFIAKPFQMGDVLRKLREVLDLPS